MTALLNEPAPLMAASLDVNLDGMTIKQLLKYANENGISGVSSAMRKGAIIDAIKGGV